MELGKVFIDSVQVGTRHRELDASKLGSLAESMKALGLQQPISVWLDEDEDVHLVTGRHRLEAARSLGWEEIEAFFVKLPPIEREMWEIAENLYRVDLSKEQRDAHIRRYAELLKEREAAQSRQSVAIESKRADGKGHRPEGIARKVAEETGVSQRTVQRVLAEPKPRPVVQPPSAPLNDQEAVNKQVDRLVKAWDAAGPEAREQFREYIDGPVFDRGAA